MNTQYFEKWAELVKKAQKPLQELADLNMKVIREYDPKAFDKVLGAKKPEELFEIQVKLAVDHGKKSIDYFEKSMKIFEKSTTEFAKDVKEAVKEK